MNFLSRDVYKLPYLWKKKKTCSEKFIYLQTAFCEFNNNQEKIHKISGFH
jgi:hypothetical protein